MSINKYPNQYVGGLSPKQKARRWKQKKWFKVRHMGDLCDPRARLIPIYSSGGVRNNPILLPLAFYIYCAYSNYSIYPTITSIKNKI